MLIAEIDTELGTVSILLRTDLAPKTCAYFRENADLGRFGGTSFFRVLNEGNQPGGVPKIHIIQGGIKYSADARQDPLQMETTEITGLKHRKYAVSQPRFGVGTAYAGFFICLEDEPELDYGGRRNPDGQGFSAFGEVISGKDVVQAIYLRAGTEPFLENEVEIKGVTYRQVDNLEFQIEREVPEARV
ncbi:peptidylprolyl isomerase [Kordiimonas lipolytica]|uniref:Peptidylprolyl isomerase n=1 Tax=Kordiimonas lipolytica TaxID=1662421 RepID=A0ABV8UFE0_9PROT|nr:peptidylprolyl isomerase [Kordiimonas lipolytica]